MRACTSTAWSALILSVRDSQASVVIACLGKTWVNWTVLRRVLSTEAPVAAGEQKEIPAYSDGSQFRLDFPMRLGRSSSHARLGFVPG